MTGKSSAAPWLRAFAIIFFLFALGHTMGTAAPHATRGLRESMLFSAMQGFRFPVMGFERSHWDFYRGFAQTVSVLQVMVALFGWQLAGVSRVSAAAALPMAWTLLAGSAAVLVLCFAFFFWVPIIFALAATGCAGMAVVELRKATA